MTSYSALERAALADLLNSLGPEAPTLNEGWQTGDLLAHLVLRERPTEAIAVLVDRLRGAGGPLLELMKSRRDYPELLQMLRSGPPFPSPLAIGPLERLANTGEFFIHHEDVRRAQPEWAPRELPGGMQEKLWGQLRLMSKLLTRSAPAGLVLRRADGRTIVANAATPVVTLTAEPSELLLYVFGRQRVAQVQADGDADAVQKMSAASFSV